MKYYILKGTIKGTGASPQSETYTHSVNYNDENSVQYMNFNPNFQCKLEYVNLVPRAKITDVISTPANKIMAKVVSQKFIDIIKKFDCKHYNLYPIKLRHKGKVYDNYYMLKFNEDSFIHINNSASNISLSFEGTEIDFSSYSKDDFIKLFNKELKDSRMNGKMFFFYHFTVEKVVFDDDFQSDLFSLRNVPTPHPGIYLSDRLVDALLENGITGAEFKEVAQIVHE